jgi:hypothetical protein
VENQKENSVGELQRRDQLEDLGIYGGIILKLVLNKSVRV